VSRLHAAFVCSAENVASGPTMENVEQGASISPTYASAAWLRVEGCDSLFDSISYLQPTMPLLAARSNPSLKRTHAMLFSTLMQTYGDWRRFNANLRELSHLSDRELADLGITRADIYRLAWDNARKAA
jgi:uncharacterized protein YjiS (DUF1127 family)